MNDKKGIGNGGVPGSGVCVFDWSSAAEMTRMSSRFSSVLYYIATT